MSRQDDRRQAASGHCKFRPRHSRQHSTRVAGLRRPGCKLAKKFMFITRAHLSIAPLNARLQDLRLERESLTFCSSWLSI
jgi:hypothetical protein